MNEIDVLFAKVKNLTYPDEMKVIAGEISRIAFFPGGKGTYDKSATISDKKVMVIGQDFDSAANLPKYQQQSDDDIRKNATWRNLVAFLEEVNIKPPECFFTNAIMGARTTGKPTGKSPAFKDKDFIRSCQDFFLQQIEIQKPEAILVLGIHTAQFLSGTSKCLAGWQTIKSFVEADKMNEQVKKDVLFKNGIRSCLALLIHPSFRPVNVGRRSFRAYKGHEAEKEMVKRVLNL